VLGWHNQEGGIFSVEMGGKIGDELTLVKGRDVALRIRGIAKARIGPKNETISQFGVAPLRPRIRRTDPGELPGPIPAPAPPAGLPPQKGGDPPPTS
jgi:hypothetical protein